MLKGLDIVAGGHRFYSSCSGHAQFSLTLLDNRTHLASKSKILKAETVRKDIYTDMLPGIGCTTEEIGEFKASNPQAMNEGIHLPVQPGSHDQLGG